MPKGYDEEIGLVGILAGFAIVLLIFWENYPTVACFIVAAALAGLTANSKSIWLKAANSMLIPAVLGFGLISLLQLYFNWFLDLDAPSSADTPIAATEYTLLAVAKTLPEWTKLGLLPTVLVLFTLMLLSGALNRFKPVAHWLWALKILGRLIGTLAIATTFSFFSSDDVLRKYVEKANTHVTLIYNKSRQRELQHLAGYLSSRATAQAVAEMPPPGRTYVLSLLKTTAAFEPIDRESLHELAKVLSYEHSPPKGQNFNIERETEIVAASNTPAKELLSDPKRAIDEQHKFEATAEKLASDERARAIEEILNKTLALPTGRAKALAGIFFSTMMGEQEGILVKEAATYLGKVSDKYFEKLTGPTVKKVASIIQSAIYPQSSIAFEASKLAAGNSRRALRFLAITRPHRMVKSALSGLNDEPSLFTYRASLLFSRAEAEVQNFGSAYEKASTGQQQVQAHHELEITKSIIADAKGNGGLSQERLKEIRRQVESFEAKQKARIVERGVRR